jgi:hypothetical protein
MAISKGLSNALAQLGETSVDKVQQDVPAFTSAKTLGKVPDKILYGQEYADQLEKERQMGEAKLQEIRSKANVKDFASAPQMTRDELMKGAIKDKQGNFILQSYPQDARGFDKYSGLVIPNDTLKKIPKYGGLDSTISQGALPQFNDLTDEQLLQKQDDAYRDLDFGGAQKYTKAYTDRVKSNDLYGRVLAAESARLTSEKEIQKLEAQDYWGITYMDKVKSAIGTGKLTDLTGTNPLNPLFYMAKGTDIGITGVKAFSQATIDALGGIVGSVELNAVGMPQVQQTASWINDHIKVLKIKTAPYLNSAENIGGWEDPEFYVRGVASFVPHLAGVMLASAGGAIMGGAATGTPAGATIGGAAGGVAYGYAMESGSMYNDLIERGIDKTQAGQLSMIYGAVAAPLEALGGSGQTIGKFVLEPAAAKLFKSALKAETKATLFSMAGKAGKQFALSGFGEGITEGTQQFAQNVLTRFADKSQNIWANVGESFVFGGLSGGITGTVTGQGAEAPSKGRVVDPAQGMEAGKVQVKDQVQENISPKKETSEALKAKVKDPEAITTQIAMALGKENALKNTVEMGEKLVAAYPESAEVQDAFTGAKQQYAEAKLRTTLLNESFTQANTAQVVKNPVMDVTIGKNIDGKFIGKASITVEGKGTTLSTPEAYATEVEAKASTAAMSQEWLAKQLESKSIQNTAQAAMINKSIDEITKVPEVVATTFEEKAKQYKTPEEFMATLGDPLLHGTTAQFEEFDINKAGTRSQFDKGFAGQGIYFTNSQEVADSFRGSEDGKSGRVVEAYANIPQERILTVGSFEEINTKLGLPMKTAEQGEIEYTMDMSPKIRDKAIAMGYDAIKVNSGRNDKYGKPTYEMVVFDTKNIKTKEQISKMYEKNEDSRYVIRGDGEIIKGEDEISVDYGIAEELGLAPNQDNEPFPAGSIRLKVKDYAPELIGKKASMYSNVFNSDFFPKSAKNDDVVYNDTKSTSKNTNMTPRTAEEFINSMGKPIYHGGDNKISEFKPYQIYEGRDSEGNAISKVDGVYFTNNLKEAGRFGKEVTAGFLSKDAKIKKVDLRMTDARSAVLMGEEYKRNVLREIKKAKDEGYDAITIQRSSPTQGTDIEVQEMQKKLKQLRPAYDKAMDFVNAEVMEEKVTKDNINEVYDRINAKYPVVVEYNQLKEDLNPTHTIVLNPDVIKTKDQLVKEYENSKPKSSASLKKEALKYDTVAEFLNAQPTKFYHGSPETVATLESGSDTGSRFQENQMPGIYLTPDLDTANYYAGRGRVASEVYFNGKLLEVDNMQALGKIIGVDRFPKDVMQKIPGMVREMGYDGVFLKQGGERNEVVVFNATTLKTEQQLKEIYKKAHSESKGKSPSNTTTTKTQLQDSLKKFHDTYNTYNDKYNETLYRMVGEMENSTAGYRKGNEDGSTFAAESTFPRWVPNDLRSKALFENTILNNFDFENLVYPPSRNSRQVDLIDAFYDNIDRAMKMDTKALRNNIKELQYSLKEEVKPVISSENKDFVSKLSQRMADEFGTETVLAQHININEESEKAVNLVKKDRQQAYRIAMGIEETSTTQQVFVNNAMYLKAMEEGNIDLANQLVKRASLVVTDAAQTLNAAKSSVSDHSARKYVQELILTRFLDVANDYLKDVQDKQEKTTPAQRVKKIIKKEVASVKEKISTKKRFDLKQAQEFISSLQC